jgi:hypothetical protein
MDSCIKDFPLRPVSLFGEGCALDPRYCRLCGLDPQTDRRPVSILLRHQKSAPAQQKGSRPVANICATSLSSILSDLVCQTGVTQTISVNPPGNFAAISIDRALVSASMATPILQKRLWTQPIIVVARLVGSTIARRMRFSNAIDPRIGSYSVIKPR